MSHVVSNVDARRTRGDAMVLTSLAHADCRRLDGAQAKSLSTMVSWNVCIFLSFMGL
jgi:hypothetical protein